MQEIIKVYKATPPMLRIVIGMILGMILGIYFPRATYISILGKMFVGALMGIAPVLVFVLVFGSILEAEGTGIEKGFGRLIFYYMLSTFLATICAVVTIHLFPITLKLKVIGGHDAHGSIAAVIENLLTQMVMNPITALDSSNYISILFWAVFLGCVMRCFASKSFISGVKQVSDGISELIKLIISCSPLGIMGLVFGTVSTNGVAIFGNYGTLLCVLVGCMLFDSCIVNPIIVALSLRRNPYPLFWKCITKSGIPAFFIRSSVANIPINMALCEELGIDRKFYSLAIPLGATVNMNGAAINLTIMTLATTHTLGIKVDFPSAIMLCLLATVAACGTSGIPNGSLMLIPVVCSMFSISNNIAMQVVAISFVIAIVQDSFATALNSSGDVLFTATSDFRYRLLCGEEIKF